MHLLRVVASAAALVLVTAPLVLTAPLGIKDIKVTITRGCPLKVPYNFASALPQLNHTQVEPTPSRSEFPDDGATIAKPHDEHDGSLDGDGASKSNKLMVWIEKFVDWFKVKACGIKNKIKDWFKGLRGEKKHVRRRRQMEVSYGPDNEGEPKKKPNKLVSWVKALARWVKNEVLGLKEDVEDWWRRVLGMRDRDVYITPYRRDLQNQQAALNEPVVDEKPPNKVVSWLKSGWDWVKDKAHGFKETVVGGVNGLFGKKKPSIYRRVLRD